MNTSGFYKLNSDQTGLIYAPNFVHGPGYSLTRESHENETYPVNGWTWYESDVAAYSAAGIAFTPEQAEPAINRHQAKIVLLRHGLLETVETAIANGSPEMQLAWKEAPQFRRNSPTLLAMASALNLSDAEVDALFAEALAVDV